MEPVRNNIFKQAFLLLILSSLLVTFMAASAWAFAQGYASQDQGLQPGMAVALSESSTEELPVVERATQENLQRVVGIATNPDQNLITAASGEHQTYVQSSGTVSAFVSDLNGKVEKDDLLTVSPIKGVLMRSSDNSLSIGTALEDFASFNAESKVISTDDGEQTVQISEINISLAKLLSSGLKPGQGNDSSIKELGYAVAGKDVAEFRVIAALAIFLIVMIAEGTIIYGAISSSIISLGRNPFSKGIIRAELVRVLLLAVLVLTVGLASIYAVVSL